MYICTLLVTALSCDGMGPTILVSTADEPVTSDGIDSSRRKRHLPVSMSSLRMLSVTCSVLNPFEISKIARISATSFSEPVNSCHWLDYKKDRTNTNDDLCIYAKLNKKLREQCIDSIGLL